MKKLGLVLLMLGMVCSLSNVFIFREHGINFWFLGAGLVFVVAGSIIMRRVVIQQRKEDKDN